MVGQTLHHLSFENVDTLDLVLGEKLAVFGIILLANLQQLFAALKLHGDVLFGLGFGLLLCLGLLGAGTLAVHCVHVDAAEAALLAHGDTAVCLCPRSNANLAVGAAPVEMLAHAGVLLCLGTDGLSSNSDLDVRKEAVALRRRWGLPAEALIRMLTVNGVAALGLDDRLGRLYPGSMAGIAVLPEELLP